MIPKYSRIPEAFRNEMVHVTDFYITLGWRSQYVGVDRIVMDGVTYYFLDNEYYFKQNYVYSDGDF
jgi:starch synthase